MAITRVGVGAQAVSATNGAGVTAAYPAAYTPTANDFGVVVLAGRPISVTTEPTDPAGWTKRNTLLRAGTANIRVSIYYRVIQAGDTAPSFTVPDAAWGGGTTGGMSVQMAVYRGVDTTNPFDVADATLDSVAATTFTPTGVTTVTNGAWVLSAVCTADDNALALLAGSEQGFTAPMSGASYDTTTGSDHAIGLADKEIVAFGAVTCPTWNQTLVGSDPWVSITVALRPAGSGASIPLDVGALTLTGFPLTISKSVPLQAGALTLTGFPLTIGKGVPLGLGQLVLDGFPLSIGKSVPLQAGSLVLTGAALSISKSTVLGTGALVLTGFPLGIARAVPLGLGQLVLDGLPITISAGGGTVTIPLGAGELVLTGFPLTIVTSTPPPPAPPRTLVWVFVGGRYRSKYL